MKTELFLLGLMSIQLKKKAPGRLVFIYMVTATRLLYAQRWKATETAKMEEWVAKMADFAEIDSEGTKLLL